MVSRFLARHDLEDPSWAHTLPRENATFSRLEARPLPGWIACAEQDSECKAFRYEKAANVPKT